MLGQPSTEQRSLGWAQFVAGAALLLAACNPYDPDGLRFPPGDGSNDAGSKDAGKDSGSPLVDASDDGSKPCVPSAEICNGDDDDCDGIVDNKVAAQLDCESQLLHVDSSCESGVCLRLSDCYEGFRNCDGDPSNGCEPLCEVCGICEDAGAGDGGAIDGG